jgi:site-specific DNA-methyltransferase (adenine-specific)
MTISKAPRNRTVTLSAKEKKTYSKSIVYPKDVKNYMPLNSIIQGDVFQVYKYIPPKSVDLLFLDPPYNLSKQFHSNIFNKTTQKKYSAWFRSWFELLLPSLKETASIYVCGDWHTSLSIYEIINETLIVQNRITWEREKGRGAKANFKNSHEDIWFATKSPKYTFNVDAIKLKRKVIAPYRVNGNPKDWQEEVDGNFRLTHPSNLWTDISIPFWSMPENTIHPTQKPEKLLAKLILASTNEGDVVFDPFLGSGTTSVVAKKLNRNFYGIELTEEYIYLALKRLELAKIDPGIQGYSNGVFWERNTLAIQKRANQNEK